MKIYITGATGFVGSYVTQAAVTRGHEVTAVVRPTSSFVPDPSKPITPATVDLSLIHI